MPVGIGPDGKHASFYQAFRYCSNANAFNSAVEQYGVNGFINSYALYGAFRYCYCNFNLNNWNTVGQESVWNTFDANGSVPNLKIDGWNFESFNHGTSNFMRTTTMATANYDAVLIAMVAQDIVTGLTWDFGSSKYSSAAATARETLTKSTGEGGKGLILVDGGLES